MTKPKTAEQKAKPVTAKKVAKPKTTKPPFSADVDTASTTEPIPTPVYSPPAKTIILNKVFGWNDHIIKGKTAIPVTKMGAMGSKGFMLVYEDAQQAENQFPGKGTIEI